MRVIRCDICGEVYLPYAKIHGEGENEGEVYEGNGFSFLVIGKDGRKRPTFTAELCSRCNLVKMLLRKT